MMVTKNIKVSDKAKVFDWLVDKLEDGSLEMLFKVDSTGDHDSSSVSDFIGLIGELEAASVEIKRKKSSNYVIATLREFDKIREEVYSGYSQAGSMEDVAAIEAEAAYSAIQAVEVRNLIEPLDY
ncbi:hypothetical protein AB4455_25605 [Vibrio sp. 10N.261.46.E12]|uniref:hypothetical protein n=1 Tax=unclassified Vibrio TaxID=2614977 RepID=UPI001055A75F|nr:MULTISPECIES: hypothetical protein [unclassified Vibrio]